MSLAICRIEVPTADLARLQADVRRPVFVNAVLHRGGRMERVRLGYRGNRTRGAPKKSFEVRRSGGTLHLNAEYDDPSMLRNALSFWFFRQLGVPAPRTRHCQVFLNGDDLGVYLEIEGVDGSFFRRRGLGCRSLFYAVNHDANFGLFASSGRRFKASLFDGYQRVIGGLEDQKRFERFIFDLNTLQGAAAARRLTAQLDAAQYVRWLAGAVCTGNADGFTQNYAVFESSEDGRYRFLPWDYEGSWGRNCHGEPCPVDAVSAFGDNVLTAKLLAIPAVRHSYRQLLRRLTQTVFHEHRIVSLVYEWMWRIGHAVLADSARARARQLWAGEAEVIRRYVRDRRQYLLEAVARDESRDDTSSVLQARTGR
ncbi:MAG: CotH kinase family protein [Alicyclobacillaceae bacterium]|nr:CotH kinase family protein [Alicyclobacillaceae bacterium]